MPKGYWIAHGRIDDPEAYDLYRAAYTILIDLYAVQERVVKNSWLVFKNPSLVKGITTPIRIGAKSLENNDYTNELYMVACLLTLIVTSIYTLLRVRKENLEIQR